jgi:hypothetical protein
MALKTRFLQLSITLVYIAIVALVFTSIWPFPSGAFRIDLPSAHEVTWTYSDGIVRVTAPYSVNNGGFYDVQDLKITYSVTNYTDYPLADEEIIIGTLPAGQITSSSIVFEFDLGQLYADGITEMVFNDDAINFFIEVSCYYTMRLIKFDATYEVSVPWEALIKSYGVSQVSPWPPTGTSVGVDYWLDTSSLLAPLSPASVTVQIYGDGDLLDQTTQTLRLGGNYTGSASLDIPVSPVYTSYRFVYIVSVAGLTIQDETTLVVS